MSSPAVKLPGPQTVTLQQLPEHGLDGAVVLRPVSIQIIFLLDAYIPNEFKLFRIHYFEYLKIPLMSKAIDFVIACRIRVFYNHASKHSLEVAKLFA